MIEGHGETVSAGGDDGSECHLVDGLARLRAAPSHTAATAHQACLYHPTDVAVHE
jgi:hypothetical protein